MKKVTWVWLVVVLALLALHAALYYVVSHSTYSDFSLCSNPTSVCSKLLAAAHNQRACAFIDDDFERENCLGIGADQTKPLPVNDALRVAENYSFMSFTPVSARWKNVDFIEVRTNKTRVVLMSTFTRRTEAVCTILTEFDGNVQRPKLYDHCYYSQSYGYPDFTEQYIKGLLQNLGLGDEIVSRLQPGEHLSVTLEQKTPVIDVKMVSSPPKTVCIIEEVHLFLTDKLEPMRGIRYTMKDGCTVA